MNTSEIGLEKVRAMGIRVRVVGNGAEMCKPPSAAEQAKIDELRERTGNLLDGITIRIRGTE